MSRVLPFPPVPQLVGAFTPGDIPGFAAPGVFGDAGFPNQWSAFLAGINLNATGDNPITIPVPQGGRFTRYIVSSLQVRNSGSVASLTTAQIGMFSGAGATGFTLIAAGTALSAITANTDATLTNITAPVVTQTTFLFASVPQVFLRVTQVQSAGAAVDVMLIYRPMP